MPYSRAYVALGDRGSSKWLVAQLSQTGSALRLATLIWLIHAGRYCVLQYMFRSQNEGDI